MATRATNDFKRDEMKALCSAALAAGWTQTVAWAEAHARRARGPLALTGEVAL